VSWAPSQQCLGAQMAETFAQQPFGRSVACYIVQKLRKSIKFASANVGRWAVHCPLEWFNGRVHEIYDLSQRG